MPWPQKTHPSIYSLSPFLFAAPLADVSNRQGAISDADKGKQYGDKGKQQGDKGQREANQGKRRWLETEDVTRRLFDGSENQRRVVRSPDNAGVTPLRQGKWGVIPWRQLNGMRALRI